jgi:hypothetical protein
MKPRVETSTVEALSQGPLFKSFFGGGFECSTFKRRSGRRMDFVRETRHDQFAKQDYLRLQQQGLRVAREGISWHVVEQRAGHYDFSSVLPIVEAARATSTQVIWDLCHFGWPDHLDLFKPEFVSSLAEFGACFAQWLERETGSAGFFVPVNEISFFSWASGDEGSLFPFISGRGFELKAQLVRASIEAMKAIWSVQPNARFVHIDPVIHVQAFPERPEEREEAEAYRQSQFQAWDMLAGRLWPELGGKEQFLDVIGVNFYPHNQWYYNLKGIRRIGKFRPIRRTNPHYRPFRQILSEVYQRYHRPLFVAETGAENRVRRGWLNYVCQEVDAAIDHGIPVHGICLYPILNHPGWVDDRHCHNALWDYPDDRGHREIYAPLEKELKKWQRYFKNKNKKLKSEFANGQGRNEFKTSWEAGRNCVSAG